MQEEEEGRRRKGQAPEQLVCSGAGYGPAESPVAVSDLCSPGGSGRVSDSHPLPAAAPWVLCSCGHRLQQSFQLLHGLLPGCSKNTQSPRQSSAVATCFTWAPHAPRRDGEILAGWAMVGGRGFPQPIRWGLAAPLGRPTLQGRALLGMRHFGEPARLLRGAQR